MGFLYSARRLGSEALQGVYFERSSPSVGYDVHELSTTMKLQSIVSRVYFFFGKDFELELGIGVLRDEK
jgi:hypothetical protein